MRLRQLAWSIVTVVLLAAPAPASAFFFQDFAGPESATNGVVIGPDGNFWAAEEFSAQGSVVRLSPSGAVLGRYVVGSDPIGVAVGPGGRVWVAVNGANKLVWIDAQAAAPAVHDVPTPAGCPPVAVVAGGDGLIYYSMPSCGAGRLGAVADTGLGAHASAELGETYDLEVAGGKLFAPDFGGDVVRRIALGTSFTVESVVATPPGSGPDGVTSDGAGNVWSTLWNTGQVARFPALQVNGSAAVVTPTGGTLTNPFGIVAGADGRMYVAGKGSANVVRISADGSAFQFYGLPDSEPFNIINGFDGDIWFSDQRKTRIVRLVNAAPRATTGAAAATSASSASASASVDPRGNDTQVVFDYGPTTAYGSTSAAVAVPNGATPAQVTGVLAGLAPSTTYHVRARATNAEGTATGDDVTFATPAGLVDADGDGASPPLDCNDANRAIGPGAVDVPGNKIDENCDGHDAAYPKLDVAVSYEFAYERNLTRFTVLAIHPAPKGSTVRISCTGRGCFKKAKTRKVTKDARRLSLSKLVRRYKLHPGARLEIRVTKPGTIGIVRRFTIRSRKRSPTRANLCLKPGDTKPGRCPL
jgi:streptogramin lyase